MKHLNDFHKRAFQLWSQNILWSQENKACFVDMEVLIIAHKLAACIDINSPASQPLVPGSAVFLQYAGIPKAFH